MIGKNVAKSPVIRMVQKALTDVVLFQHLNLRQTRHKWWSRLLPEPEGSSQRAEIPIDRRIRVSGGLLGCDELVNQTGRYALSLALAESGSQVLFNIVLSIGKTAAAVLLHIHKIELEKLIDGAGGKRNLTLI